MEEISHYVKVPNTYIKGYVDEIFNDYELLTYIFIKRNYMMNDSYAFNMLELTDCTVALNPIPNLLLMVPFTTRSNWFMLLKRR